MRPILALCLLIAMCTPAISGKLPALNTPPEEEKEVTEKIDDWQFNQQQVLEERNVKQSMPGSKISGMLTDTSAIKQAANIAIGVSNKANMGSVAAPAPQSLGFAVGGAKDTGSFIQNLDKGYLPKYDSITYEGLFYDYFFDTGVGQGKCNDLFCPSFSRAVTSDLYSGETDYYLSIGLNSGLTEASFQRKKLNLVIVVDISGSMGSRFDKYFYDAPSSKASNEDTEKTKMQIANESIVAMMTHLQDEDRFGVVLFDDRAFRAKPLRLVRHTDMKAISRHILELKQQGGTNWKAGYDDGVKLFSSMEKSLADPNIYENRIIFITDAMPNIGELSKDGLFGMVRDAANNGIFTTFIGVGIDFNPDLVQHVTKTRGANYFSVHSASEFKKRLADEFDFMVTPLVFDLELQVASKNYTIEGVFGSPEADLATGEVMKINTLFPSRTEDEQVKGGVVLVKLKKTSPGDDPVNLTVRYKDRVGKQFKVEDKANFAGDKPGFDNNGIRKAVLLTEYVSLIKNWLLDAHKGCNDQVEQPIILPLPRYGIVNPQTRPEIQMLPTWERKSCPLDASPGYRNFFTLFSKHFREEMQIIGDKTLDKELKILMKLAGTNSNNTSHDNGPIDDWGIKR
ncbi:MAG: VWA domain-containing protein [Pseudomonadota bacterium]